jgi:XTP/dITP diphosphohydrolase
MANGEGLFTVWVATRNEGKKEELRALFASGPFALAFPEELEDVEETGSSYVENATLKARALAMARGVWALADDSGLEVEALGGAPGVRSARYAGEGATDAQNRKKLLDEMRRRPPAYRKARFVCVMALASPEGEVFTAEGECAGRIGTEERGDGGFGYDKILWFPDLGKTMAEMSDAEKNRISHRSKAAEKLGRLVRTLAAEGRIPLAKS